MSMKLRVVLMVVVLALALPGLSLAQFEAGKSMAGPSLGLSFLGSSVQFGLNYEYGMKMDFGMVGIGGLFRYWSYSETYFGGGWKYTDVLIGAQANYHFKMENDKLDPWAGLVLAYDVGSVSWEGQDYGYSSPTHGGMFLGGHAGGRYWFSPTMAVTARFGFGTLGYSALDLGVDFKF
ncbi:MAG: hypothetical protein WD295_03100 [Bacteroidota bacterium]